MEQLPFKKHDWTNQLVCMFQRRKKAYAEQASGEYFDLRPASIESL